MELHTVVKDWHTIMESARRGAFRSVQHLNQIMTSRPRGLDAECLKPLVLPANLKALADIAAELEGTIGVIRTLASHHRAGREYRERLYQAEDALRTAGEVLMDMARSTTYDRLDAAAGEIARLYREHPEAG